MAKVEVQRSAGGVLYQEREGQMWIVLIATRQGAVWGLPKGLIEKGEDPLQAAVREVREESGLQGENVADLGHIEYWYRDSNSGVLYHKFVHYFLLRYVSGDVPDHGWEVDEARWFSVDDALHVISYENERQVLLSARERWSSLPRETL
ncbi:MAG TPA: NUDIX hydrolase [Anaerolineae bacterium]|nr:NUDIX hydrolase [Anaerolineae bacterium]